jgi:hypothetical protein
MSARLLIQSIVTKWRRAKVPFEDLLNGDALLKRGLGVGERGLLLVVVLVVRGSGSETRHA